MTKCSGAKQADCKKPGCEWVKGKGCRKGSSASGGLAGEVVVFTGFRDDGLKAAVEKAGGRVTAAVSGKTTLLVYVRTARNGAKVDGASCKKMTREGFAKKYGFAAEVEGEVVVVKKKGVLATKPKKKMGEAKAAKAHHTFGIRLHDGDVRDVAVPKQGGAPISVGDNVFVINGVPVSVMKLWSQARHIVHSIYDKKITETKKVVKALYYNPASGKFAVALFHKSGSVPRDWDLSLVEFEFHPEKNPGSPRSPVCFSFEPHRLATVAKAVKKAQPKEDEIPVLPGAKGLGFVYLFELPMW